VELLLRIGRDIDRHIIDDACEVAHCS
jgi:hypothetical protein